jgi:hypothetical protein
MEPKHMIRPSGREKSCVRKNSLSVSTKPCRRDEVTVKNILVKLLLF